MSLNPRGLIPTLSFHGKPIYESSVILQLLEDAYPTHKPSLLPDDPYEKAYARLWMDFVGTRIVPAFHRYLQHEGNDKEGLNKARQEYLDKWREFQGAMKDGGGPFFLGGDNPSLVDVAAAPWVQRHWVLDEMKGPFEVGYLTPR